ncbi:MAG: reductive dehalogenase domain-containing protein [Myxococcota bacterium]
MAPQKTAPIDPVQASAMVKQIAREAGASLVGITRLAEHMRYHNFDMPFAHAIAIGIPMERETMVHTPSDRSVQEIMRAYTDANRIAIAVAEHIRSLGWPARASTNISPDATEVLHVPIALAAGLGQLGKHGSMITAEHGSNVRLAVVLTDLPLHNDQPRDIGVDDFCAKCRICEQNCPPKAISPHKQIVRGVEKWYVDFDACAPYFAKTAGCGICIHACPWSEPGRGFVLSERLLARRQPHRQPHRQTHRQTHRKSA